MDANNLSRLAESITRDTGIASKRNVEANRCTTFFIGGSFEYLFEPNSHDQLASLMRICRGEGLKPRILGAGSNLLINDRRFSDIVIRLGRAFKETRAISPEEYWIGGAASLMTASRSFSEKGLSGLEFAGGIPASVGGAVRMNAGAHGGEIKDCLTAVRYINQSGEIFEEEASQIEFSYRTAGIPKDAVITDARFQFIKDDPKKVADKRAQNLEERKKRQPLSYPSAGSVFRNPSPEKTAGYLIDKAGLKGMKIGGAEISSMHGNWIINPHRNAAFADVTNLMQLAIETVSRDSGITLIPEIVRWE